MEFLESKARLKRLAEAADIYVDSNIPIRRYYRSGSEMLRMAKVYAEEGSLEAAYILYLKYITLFLEKIKQHKDFSQVLPAEKKKSKNTLMLTLSITEEMKQKLTRIFEVEHAEWLVKEKGRKAEEERRRLEEEDRRRIRMEEDRKRQDMIDEDHKLALWTQAQIDQGLENTRPAGYDPNKYAPSPPPPDDSLFKDANAPVLEDLSAPPPSYEDLASDFPPSSHPAAAGSSTVLSGPTVYPSVPSFDRSSKPSSSDNRPDITPTIGSLGIGDRPAIPDRSTKPANLNLQDQRAVIVPQKLIDRFLQLAKSNSDRNIETLGMLGGKLAKNKFTVTHLLLPKQSGKSDRCDLENYEELGDTYDREDIILVGWIHTHPAYDVFLSSVDMHNQYEYQNMLPEFVGIVCSIKFNQTGCLTLTDHGMSEIGACNLDNFHPHSKNPPLFEVASHVTMDPSLEVVIKDLR